ncbi:hypothetical protein ASPVEDRAFT_653782 [Aspergillus versicolor CBS 583.65]|uniref:FAD dependent oxidoreductase domain-containing protein n=1 Tax=Aspergillus versicolor CBS 583.65 TaxID=1036611 RepID=A0A1L9PK87_ASPVE|nr:uncharacterized protein ASPVEDRAFT_653782 [Aspergillus versicolor CBS 583.65]OJJ01948.1 hypothetical protein ASPVEDRAFT_653782 [Aspergillus versicolor CBS 583.65]
MAISSTYDVIVVGGGAAGIGAAVGAKQANPSARVLLVESEACLGGAATHRGVVSYCGLYTLEENARVAVGQIWGQLRRRLLEVAGTAESPVRHRGIFQVIDPECLKLVLDDLVTEYNIEVLLHATVVGAQRSAVNDTLVSVDVQDRRGAHRVYGRAFVDCSGDGDLAYHGGASTRHGNHGRVNLGSLAIRFGGVAADANPTAAMWRQALVEAKLNTKGSGSVLKKVDSVLIRLPRSGHLVCFLPTACYDTTDTASITQAEMSARRQAQEYCRVLQQLPGHGDMYIVSTGPNFGTRESRHVNAVYQLTKQDITTRTQFTDVVALGAWAAEFHDEDDPNWASTFELPPGGCFEIPLGCLQSSDTSNLFVAGRCADGDQYAASAIRVMGTSLATGQAAGVAASFVAQKGTDWTVRDVQECLKAAGAFLDSSKLPAAPPIS